MKRSLSSRGAGFPRSIGKAKAQKGTYFVHNQELFFASPNIQVCVHENKEWGELNTSAQKCLAKQFSTGSTSDLFSWKRRMFPGVQVDACSRLTLGIPLPLQEWRWLPSSQTRLEPSQWWKERSSLSSTPWALRLEVSP